jgi:hypothetical protein
MCSATELTDCFVMRVEKKAMGEVLHRERAFSCVFVAYLLESIVSRFPAFPK